MFPGDAKSTYGAYIQNLDKLAIYVDSKGGAEQIDEQSKTCGFVSRLNNALFKPKLHIQCVRPLYGRYVYIEAWGVPNRFNRLFSAVLCEVMVYEWSARMHTTTLHVDIYTVYACACMLTYIPYTHAPCPNFSHARFEHKWRSVLVLHAPPCRLHAFVMRGRHHHAVIEICVVVPSCTLDTISFDHPFTPTCRICKKWTSHMQYNYLWHYH